MRIDNLVSYVLAKIHESHFDIATASIVRSKLCLTDNNSLLAAMIASGSSERAKREWLPDAMRESARQGGDTWAKTDEFL